MRGNMALVRKSYYNPSLAEIAQLVEHLTENQGVASSNLALGTCEFGNCIREPGSNTPLIQHTGFMCLFDFVLAGECIAQLSSVRVMNSSDLRRIVGVLGVVLFLGGIFRLYGAKSAILVAR